MSGSAAPPRSPRQVALADRYELEEGRVFLTGVQALVRVLLDQHRADARAGLRTATLVSGYQGSPLAGLDQELERLGALGAEHDDRAAPRRQRGARRDRRVGLAARGHAAGPALRRRRRRLVRQGARRRPRRRRDPPRQPASAPIRRGGVLALCGDDPGVQVLDDPERVRVAARGAAGPDPRARAASRRRSTSAATRSPARARPGCGRR